MRPGPANPEAEISRSTLRRKELQARLHAEKVLGELVQQQAQDRAVARRAELQRQQSEYARAEQLRVEARIAKEIEDAATARSGESRALRLALKAGEAQPASQPTSPSPKDDDGQPRIRAVSRQKEEEKQLRVEAKRDLEASSRRGLASDEAERIRPQFSARVPAKEDTAGNGKLRRVRRLTAIPGDDLNVKRSAREDEPAQVDSARQTRKAASGEQNFRRAPVARAAKTSRKSGPQESEIVSAAAKLRTLQRQRAVELEQRYVKEATQKTAAKSGRKPVEDSKEGRIQAPKVDSPSKPARAKAVPRKRVAPRSPERDIGAKVRRKRRSLASFMPLPRAAAQSAARAAAMAPANAMSQSTNAPNPYLQTRGSFLVNGNGDALNLRGVTVRGLDAVAPHAGQMFPAVLALDPTNLSAITQQWGANLVRLPFAASTILTGNGQFSASDLLAGLDLTVGAITAAGAFVLLALEVAARLGASDPSVLQVWQTLAVRYQAEPRVFYEIFVSPTAAAPGDLAALIGAVRQSDPAALLFVGGGTGGTDVSAIPLVFAPGQPIPNLVYTIAVPGENVPNPNQLSAVSGSYPIFASVWSDDGADLGRTSSRVSDLFERCGIGWSAANWNADPRLVNDAAGQDFSPTLWGRVVQRAVALMAPPLLEPADAQPSLSMLRDESAELSRLATSGNTLLDEQGNAVLLRGVTVTGLDTAAVAPGQTLPDTLALDANNLALLTGTWGMNLVRIPFQAQTVLSGNGSLSGGEILAGLDLAIARIAEGGMFTLLSLEAPPVTAPLPDSSTLQAWQMLANRYQGQAGVHFEIFASQSALGSGWLQSALALVAAIRQQNANALIFMSSGNSGTDVTGLPLLQSDGNVLPNIVYTIQVSPQSMPGPDDGPLGIFADANPVFASSWSDDANDPSRISPSAAEFFNRHSIGFAASNWNADPQLVTDAVNHNFSPTAWGLIAKRAATLPLRPALKAFQ